MTPIQELVHDLKVTVTPDDLKRLQPHLAGWNHLNEILLLKQVSTDDIKKLLLIEVTGQRRQMILDKLAARLKSKELAQLRRHINLIIQNCCA